MLKTYNYINTLWLRKTAYVDNILPEVSNLSKRIFRTHPCSASQSHILSSNSQSGLAGKWHQKSLLLPSGERGGRDKYLFRVSICEVTRHWGVHDQWEYCKVIGAANKRSLFNLMWFAKPGIKELSICGLRFNNLPCFIISSHTPSITVKSSTAISPLLPLPTVPSITN